jgi:hypothetical protein
MPSGMKHSTTNLLAESAAGDILAASALLATCDADARPRPAGTSTRGTKDINICSATLDCALNVAECQTCDRHTIRRRACGRAVLVVLLDNDAVLADVRERDVFVSHSGNRAGRFVDGLYAHAVLGVGNSRGGDGDILYGVVASATDGADREAVAAGAVAVSKCDTLVKKLNDVVGGEGL